jgi:hypothetical protein
MAVEVRQSKSTEQKIADRLRNSGEGSNPNVHTVHGEGPTRVHHNIHHAGHYVQPNTQAKPTEDSRVASHQASKSQGGGSVG